MTVSSHDISTPNFGSRKSRRWSTTLIALVLLLPLLWRAGRSVDFLLNRRVGSVLPSDVIADFTRTTAEREDISFGPYVEAYRFLARNVPENGIVSVWGVDSSERHLLTLSFNAHLYPRRVAEPTALGPYLERHPDEFDDRAFILRYLPSGDLPEPWPGLVKLEMRTELFEIYRLRTRIARK